MLIKIGNITCGDLVWFSKCSDEISALDKGDDYSDLYSALFLGCTGDGVTVDEEMLAEIRPQAKKFAEKYGEKLSKRAIFILRQLSQ